MNAVPSVHSYGTLSLPHLTSRNVRSPPLPLSLHDVPLVALMLRFAVPSASNLTVQLPPTVGYDCTSITSMPAPAYALNPSTANMTCVPLSVNGMSVTSH